MSRHNAGNFIARHRDVIVAVVALLLGAAVFAYPMVSNFVYQMNAVHVTNQYKETVDEATQKELDAAKLAAITYNQKLLGSRTIITDPFDPNAQQVTDEEYESVLNPAGDGVMGTISIPKIHVELPIYHGTSDEVLEEGVGHLQETSVPIGGESTHAVLSGHTGLPSGKIFDNLDQLEVGNYFIITVLGEDHAYRVTSTEVVLPDETDSLVIQPGKDLVTLVTCTPYGVNTHRLLVHAERCEVPEEWLNKGDADFPAGYSDPPDKALLPSILIGLLLAAAIIGGYVAWSKWRKSHGAAPGCPSPGRGGHGGSGGRPLVDPARGAGAYAPVRQTGRVGTYGRSATNQVSTPPVQAPQPGMVQPVRPVVTRSHTTRTGGVQGKTPRTAVSKTSRLSVVDGFRGASRSAQQPAPRSPQHRAPSADHQRTEGRHFRGKDR